MKQCNSCKEFKNPNAFADHKKAKGGLQNYCKVCQKIYRENLKAKPKPQLERLVCARCNCDKDVADFPIVESSSTGYGSWCSECKVAYRKNYDYREGYKDRRRERVQWFRAIKSGKPCADCGQILESACMDYDHVCGEKIESVARMVLHNATKEDILKEIGKCELVCLLCHNRRTQMRLDAKGENKYPPHIQRNIDIINEAKSKPCECCGKQYEWFNMQFDHTDPQTKVANISQFKSAKISNLMSELSKCQVMCAVCHRKKSLVEQLDGYYQRVREMVVEKMFFDKDCRLKGCSKCHKVLSFDEFQAHTKTKSGLSSWCRNCVNEARRKRRNQCHLNCI